MRAKVGWQLALATAVAILAAACTSNTGRAPETGPRAARTSAGTTPLDHRPNIVFVLTDDLSMNLLPYMPHVRALAATGTSFPNYFVVDSLCCPSRSAIFTGQYPHNDGVFTNGGADGGYTGYNRFGNRRKSFAIGLQRAGYRTGFMGKYLNGYEPSDPQPPGWSEWDVTGGGYREFGYWLNENGKQVRYGHRARDYLTDVLDRKASGFIRSSVSARSAFALEIATFAPHRPSVPAPVDVGTFTGLRAPRGPAWNRTPRNALPWQRRPPLDRKVVVGLDTEFRRRVESVQAVDRMVGHLQQLLATEHQLGNTYFVFSSDNGYHLGEYRMHAGKQTAFDTDIRVPLIVAGPGVSAGRVVTSLASSIDLAPTFLQLAGATATDRPDGTSLVGLLHGRPTPADWQSAVLIEHHGPPSDRRDPDYQPPIAGNPPSYEALRTRTMLYTEYVTGNRELYDLARDPDELHNLIPANSVPSLLAAVVAALHAKLHALQICRGTGSCQRAATLPVPPLPD